MGTDRPLPLKKAHPFLGPTGGASSTRHRPEITTVGPGERLIYAGWVGSQQPRSGADAGAARRTREILRQETAVAAAPSIQHIISCARPPPKIAGLERARRAPGEVGNEMAAPQRSRHLLEIEADDDK